MTYEITKNGWLIAGTHRIRLANVEHYEQRGGAVVLVAAQWSAGIDCDPDPQFMARLVAGTKDPQARLQAVADKEAQTTQAVALAAEMVTALDTYFAAQQ